MPEGELHIVMLDNGRSELLGSEEFRASLNCIRCGACLNTCPVYRRSGGHSYEATIPGPIGSVLAPARDAQAYHSLPYACSLCGSCSDICPVKIPIHHQLLTWRKEIGKRGLVPAGKSIPMKLAAFIFKRPKLYELAGKLMRLIGPRMSRFLIYNRFNVWGKQRELPEFPKKSFRDLFAERKQQ
jgi:L-lactate dehydrogenase complex protein LldF